MTIITTLVTRWTRICNYDDDNHYHDNYLRQPDYVDGSYHDNGSDDDNHYHDNLKAEELIDLLSNVVQIAVDPSQDVQLVANILFIILYLDITRLD